jgi:threonine dehydratase
VGCTVVLPDTAPETKIAAIRRLGADMIPVTFDEWHQVFRTRTFEGLDGLHVHAFSDDAVMAGNGTIGLEIVEDLPDVDAVIAPYGGGGLSCGIASALHAVAPSCKVFAAEVATAAPLAPSLEAGQPVKVDYTPSFVDGIGSPEVFPEMFALAQELLDGSLVARLDDVTDIELRALVEGYGPTLNAVLGVPNRSPNNQLGDGVDANDTAFLSVFPYIGTPHQGYDHQHEHGK